MKVGGGPPGLLRLQTIPRYKDTPDFPNTGAHNGTPIYLVLLSIRTHNNLCPLSRRS